MQTVSNQWLGTLLVAFQCGCTNSTPPPADEFCAKSFCIAGVPADAVHSKNLVVDATRHDIDRVGGNVYILEDNFPNLEGLARSPVSELCHVRAWHLSPTRIPQVLVLVGAKSPYWLVVGIEGDESKRKDLVEFLGNLRIAVEQDDWPADVDRPSCPSARL